jgi:pyruvate kinase
MRRHRNAKIIATLGPSSSDEETIRRLFVAGADVFRLNFSHGRPEEHEARIDIIRRLEKDTGHPVGVLLDLQGPKLRIGTFQEGRISLNYGQPFRLDLDDTPGDPERAPLPHPEIFAALRPEIDLLLDDGRVRLTVKACGANFADTVVRTGGPLSDHKGVNVPGVVLPLSPFTDKDEVDLAFGLELGVDWVAASFIQRPLDVAQIRSRIEGRALIMAKLEKPAAIDSLDQIVELSDGLMVARGDLGVELPPEQVPSVQKTVVRTCRKAGKPVVVATQMLESMVSSPVPTRAEASDVAGAVYDGADAVMLSAETAAGEYPVEAVTIMDRIIARVEKDTHYRRVIDANLPTPRPTTADAICAALRQIAHTLPVAATVTYTSSGFSAMRAARERPEAPILGMTPERGTARRLCLVWGVHPVLSADPAGSTQMVDDACKAALTEGFAGVGEAIAIVAGLPFGQSGTTNLVRIARVPDPTRADAATRNS